MNDLNKVMLVGRLTRDCELTYLQSGSAKGDISIAFTTSKKNGNEWVDESNFLNTNIWGKTAENLNPYLKKGTMVGIEGHLKMDTYEKDGQKKTIMKVVVDNLQLLSRPNNAGATQNAPVQNPVPQNIPQYNDGMQMDETIPF